MNAMNKIKKALSLVLVFVLVATLMPMPARAASTTYSKATKFSTDESYVITVYSGRKYYAMSHSGNKISAVRVTVSNGKITSTVSADMLWKYNGGKLSYVDNGKTYYLYSGNSGAQWSDGNGGTTLTLSTSYTSAISLSSNKLRIGSYFLYYTNGILKGYKSGSTTYIFKQTVS